MGWGEWDELEERGTWGAGEGLRVLGVSVGWKGLKRASAASATLDFIDWASGASGPVSRERRNAGL